MLNQWGPALLIVFSILIGVIYNNKRLDDLRSEMDARFTELHKYLEARFKAIEDRLDRVEARLDRLEHPVAR